MIVSLGAMAVVLATDAAFARSGMRGGLAAAHPRSLAAHSFRHHRGHGFWPGAGGYVYAPDGTPIAEVPTSTSSDIRYTYTYDVPWDWAHRYPPAVMPADRPYVSSCTAEAVTVPGRGGTTQTVNVTRCY